MTDDEMDYLADEIGNAIMKRPTDTVWKRFRWFYRTVLRCRVLKILAVLLAFLATALVLGFVLSLVLPL